MRKSILAAATAAFSLTLATQALALNPQPEPPGKYRVVHIPANKLYLNSRSAGAGRFSDADDNYCGTSVPGHLPHGIGGNGGGRFADADDNYCGTKVPGHFGGPIHYNNFRGSLRNAHGDVMLNPQPLPPHDGGSRFER